MLPHETPNPTEYVLGFAFDVSGAEPSVCLILKNKPEWQAGLLNGVGGKIESGEYPDAAMHREFREETDVYVDPEAWVHFHTMRFRNGAVVHCFAAELPSEARPRTVTLEPVLMHECDVHGRWNGMRAAVPNLSWLIPMAYQELKQPVQERMIVGP